MKSLNYFFATVAVITISLFCTPVLRAQSDYDDEERVSFSRRNLGGPRLGVTYVYIGKDNALSSYFDDQKMGRQFSQFGWHFEYQVIPRGGGPQFVVEFVPLVGGVEYGKLGPGATLAMGVRFPTGWEFGLGPNVAAVPKDCSPTALVVAVGKSFDYGGVSIPLNLAYTTNPDASRVSLMIGYAIAKRNRR